MTDLERPLSSLAIDGAAAAIPGPPGWVTGVVGHAIEARVRDWKRRRVSLSLQAAEDASGLTRDQIAAHIAERGDLIPLVTRILHAAGMGGDDAILDAMGVALGQAIICPKRVPVERAFLNAVQDITAMHVQVLTVIAEPVPGGNSNLQWTRPRIAEAIEDSADWLHLALGGVVSAGLAEQRNVMLGAEVGYGITDMGSLLLDVLRARMKTQAAQASS